jgi:hypothetical protein
MGAPTTFGLLLIRTLPHRRCGSNRRRASSCRMDHVKGSPDLFELLPRPQVGRVRLSGIDLRPCGPGNLADINVAARVHRKTVRRQELAQLGPRRRVAEGATPSSVQRIWKSHGRQLDRDRTLNLSNDPKFAEKLQDVVGLYIAPPDHAIVLSCDVGRLAVHLGSHQLSVGQVLRLPLDRTLVRLAGGCARSRRRRPHRPRRLGGWSTRTAPRFGCGRGSTAGPRPGGGVDWWCNFLVADRRRRQDRQHARFPRGLLGRWRGVRD